MKVQQSASFIRQVQSFLAGGAQQQISCLLEIVFESFIDLYFSLVGA